MNNQPELPLGLSRKRPRHYPPAARIFFALGERLRHELQAERMQKMQGHGDR